MPLIHHRTFRIRSYECDAHGHLNNANYLRLMQETAFDASAAAGYDLARYQALGRLWLIRESSLEFFKPLYDNDRVEISTWIGDFRRASSRRLYEFRLAANQELAARAYSDWVFLDAASLRPASIPAHLIEDFYPEGLPTDFPPRQPFPAFPPQPAGAFRMQRRVEWTDLDTQNHVNNAIYLNYVTECSMQSLAACEWPWERLHSLGLAVHLRRCQIQYLQPALHEDQIVLTTWMSNPRRVSANRHYLLQRQSDGALLARVQTYSVLVRLEDNQPARIPGELLGDCSGMIAS